MSKREIMQAFIGLLLALLVAILSSTIVSNALPRIIADLDGTQSQYTWVITAMLLTSTATTPIWGKLADLFSKKLLYQLAIVIFTVGSVLGGFAESMPELITYRAIQGIGMGGLQALVQAVIAAMISPRDRGRYSGYIGATFAVATVSGPLLGGIIVDSPLGWRWCFWVTVPVAVLALIVLGKTLKLPVIKRHVKIDWLGATLIVGGVALVLIWVSLAGKEFDWWSPTTAAFLGGAAVALALAVFVESKVSEPVVPLKLFRNRSFSLTVIGTLAVGTAMFGGAVFLAQYYQIARGYSPTEAGLMTMPMVLGLFLSSTIAGQVVSRIGRTKPFLVAGAFILVVALSLLGTIDSEINLVQMGVYLALMGIGTGCLMQNLVLVAQNTVGMRDVGSSTAVVTFFRTLGGSAGVSALGAVLAHNVSEYIAEAAAARGMPMSGGATGASGGSTLDVEAMPAPVQAIVRSAYGDAIGDVFLIGAAVAVVTFLAVVFIKETPLRSTLDLADEEAEDTAGAGEAETPADAELPAAATAGPAGADTAPVPAARSAYEVPSSRLAAAAFAARNGATADRSATVYGVVTAAGEPASGVTLTLTDASGAQVDLTRSAEDGTFRVGAREPGRYILIAAAEHLQPSAQSVELGTSPLHRDIALTGSGQISGRVRTPQSRPVGGATVVLTDTGGDVLDASMTGGDGWYRFPDVAGGTYTLAVTAQGYRPQATPVRLATGERVTQDVELSAAGHLEGTVRSELSGTAVAEARVVLLDEVGGVAGVTMTASDGTYRFDDVEHGHYTVIASGYGPATATVQVGVEEGRQDFDLGYSTESGGPSPAPSGFRPRRAVVRGDGAAEDSDTPQG
ncbi:EmrB/QacA subfamily drug resistance transporter [Prauserella isguenensis]|uniref:EmrB/QacA subfamily drug resistance transporter n=1 Tax=Prauserella isguenensis TaxID=1470180 RepID=A0A839S075_9PSEU|nr:MFS transporter [Prauserella isguenensis]MBB3050955.1 EmrB/QacA subfamily drug resistance transporter [Prauserella isguenensis]